MTASSISRVLVFPVRLASLSRTSRTSLRSRNAVSFFSGLFIADATYSNGLYTLQQKTLQRIYDLLASPLNHWEMKPKKTAKRVRSKKQSNFRLSPEVKAVLSEVSKKTGDTETKVVQWCILQHARQFAEFSEKANELLVFFATGKKPKG